MKILSLILCLVISFTSFAKNAPTPNSRVQIIQVTPEMIQALSKQPGAKVKYYHLAQNENPVMVAGEVAKKEKDEKQKEIEERKKKEKEREDNRYTLGEFFGDLTFHDGRALLLVFAIVGAVMTVVWISSIPYSLFLAATGKEKFEYLHYLTTSYSRITSHSGRKFFKRDGDILALKHQSYFRRKKQTEYNKVFAGVATELAHYTLRDEDEFKGKTNYLSGNYWLVGPSAMVAFTPNEFFPIFMKLNLMGGTSFRSDVELIAKGEFEIGLEILKRFILSGSVAAQFIDINDNKGITSGSDPDYLLGLGLTYKFQ